MAKLSQKDLETLYSAVLQGMASLKSAAELQTFIRESNDLMRNQDIKKWTPISKNINGSMIS
jgi:hypothetical protein